MSISWRNFFRSRYEEAQRQTFAIVSSITAFILMFSLVIDLLVTSTRGMMTTEMLLASVATALFGLFWVIVPIIMRSQYPYWLGYIAYVCAFLITGYFIGFAGEPYTVTTGLQILPALALYLGWFWKPSISRPTFAVSLAFMVIVIVLSPDVGTGRAIAVSNATLALLITCFAFAVGSYLRWRHERKANVDQLTGVLNRRGVLSRLRTEMKRAIDSGEPLSLAVIDFDRFKDLNDSRGHAYGDAVLRDTIAQWRQALRGYDIIGRTGGDEFIIIFPRTSSAVADTVLSRVREVSPHEWTWGTTQMREGDQIETLFLRADEHLYDWKIKRPDRGPTAPDRDRYTGGSVERIPGQLGPFERLKERQSEFSVVSTGVSLVIFITVGVAVFGEETLNFSLRGLLLVLAALIIGAGTVVLPLLMGKLYPKFMNLVLTGLIFVLGTLVLLLADEFSTGFSVFLFSSLMALYLGAFSGTTWSRVLMVVGLVTLSGVSVWRFYPDAGSADRIILLTAIPYAFLVSWYLFEIGSYLYWRSSRRVYHDSLTGALNRFGILEFGEREIQRAQRSGAPLCVVVIDFVGFKRINDTFGHAVGDKLLIDSVNYFQSNLRPYDLVVRTGGDEFALLLPYRNAEQASDEVRQLQTQSLHPWAAGIAEIVETDDLDSLLARADVDLYAQRGVTLKDIDDPR